MNRWMGLAMLTAAALAPGCATETEVAGTTQVGKVEQVFVEAYPGLFVDRALATVVGDRQAWASVTFARPLSDGRTTAVAMLERDSGVDPGDLVQMRFAHPGAFDPDTLPGHNQVTALVAKHDSRAALSFGRGQAALSPDKLTAADPLP
ncbi:MAG TPA: hypothetical protein VD791_13740 [Burkholderiales bacterium]|nr:hypothetical protein [Burkholderiales bacterium]